MVELLGVLLGLFVAGLAWLAWRLLRALRRLLPARRPLRGLPLRLARRRLRHADARAGSLVAENQRLRRALRQAERERDQLPGRGRGPAAGRDRFMEAKRAFALRFHPDRLAAGGLERALRIAMFREYWAELRRIERG